MVNRKAPVLKETGAFLLVIGEGEEMKSTSSPSPLFCIAKAKRTKCRTLLTSKSRWQTAVPLYEGGSANSGIPCGFGLKASSVSKQICGSGRNYTDLCCHLCLCTSHTALRAAKAVVFQSPKVFPSSSSGSQTLQAFKRRPSRRKP